MMKPTSETICPLESQRLLLNPLTIKDVDDDYLTWLNDQTVTEHIDARYTPQSLHTIRGFVNGFDQTNGLIWRLAEKKSLQNIGNIQARINWLHKVADIGILVGNRDFWGIGIGTEALSCVICFLLQDLELQKVTIATRETNERMLKTIRAMGFIEEGRLKDHVRHEDSRCDIIQFGLFNLPQQSS